MNPSSNNNPANPVDVKSMPETIWSFDLGKASIGEAVRDLASDTFPHAESLLIPYEFAETKSAAGRRRMWRTRIAHHAREEWLAGIVELAGFEPLCGRRIEKSENGWRQTPESVEEKSRRDMLEREFPAKGDETQYNSAALRILLLEGKAKLADWQIYKALRSAIQKRGYGRVPWSGREEKKGGKSEEELEKEMAKKDPLYCAAVEAWPVFKKNTPAEFHSPCYYDATHIGIWSAEQPGVVELRQTHHAKSTRKVRFDRVDVDREIMRLADHAAAHWPALREAFERICSGGWHYTERATKNQRTLPVVAETFGEFLVHGPAGAPSAEALGDFHTYLEERRKRGIRPGTEDDWQAATGQKTPRFDNRIVEACGLLDGLNVCNVAVKLDPKTKAAQPDSLLYAEVTFLMKLKNTSVQAADGQRRLVVEELRHILDAIRKDARAVAADAKDYGRNVAAKYGLTKTDWGKHKGIKALGLRPMPGHEEIKAPKTDGRSRFSRPALRLIRALLLSGEKPSVFRARLLAREEKLLNELCLDVLDSPPVREVNGATVYVKQPRPWILVKHLKFIEDLARESDTWEKIHFPEQRLDALEARHTKEGALDRESAVRDLIGGINDPIVRHRLGVFTDRLRTLEGKFGTPEQIVLEFVREDFMGKTAKDALFKFQNEREKARKNARERAVAVEATGKMAGLKVELFDAQAGKCLYCGQDFHFTKLDDYRIEHIVPRAQNGPDAVVNYVLAHEKCNDEKGDQTPYQWLHGREGWDAYVQRVKACATTLRNKKVQLLTQENAADLVQRYTALAETAWISRLAQTIAGLWFGWRNGNDAEGGKRVIVISGGLTARVRRSYRLNSLLNPPPADCADLKAWEETAEKNRADDRHHALDAMVINFLPQWTRNAKKEKFFRFPDAIHKNAKEFFRQRLDAVMPRIIAFERATLAETNYGGRQAGGKTVIVQRVLLRDLGMKAIAPGKTKFDAEYLKKQIKSVRDSMIVEKLRDGIDRIETVEAWEAFCTAFRVKENGPRVLRVSVYVGEATEFKEMSKDKTGTWRKGLGSHKGQLIYFNAKGELGVLPVFAHGSVATERAKLAALGGQARVYGFFQSGCAVEIQNEIAAESYNLVVKNEAKEKRRITPTSPLAPCSLTLRSVVTKSLKAEFSLANNHRVVASLAVWVAAGLKRLEE